MSVPDFQSIMLPVLKCLSDQQDRKLSDCVKFIEAEFCLTDAEKAEMVPSGRQRKIYNRITWAFTHLRKAGLIQSYQRGMFSITQEGLKVLNSSPDKITIGLLKSYPEYVRFITNVQPEDMPQGANAETEQTPEESIGILAKKLKFQLADELLDIIYRNSPAFFEKFVVELLSKMGYGGYEGAGQVTGQTGDGGIDGIIHEDMLGLDSIYIQAKKWDKGNNVGRTEIQKFVGALMGRGAGKGVFITSSGYTPSAIEYAQNIKQAKIILIDGFTLAKLMIQHDIGVSIRETIHIKKIDSDYFEII